MAFLDQLISSLPPSKIVSFEGFKFSRQFVPSLFSLSKLLLQRFHRSHSLIKLGLRGLHFFLEVVLVLPENAVGLVQGRNGFDVFQKSGVLRRRQDNGVGLLRGEGQGGPGAKSQNEFGDVIVLPE